MRWAAIGTLVSSTLLVTDCAEPFGEASRETGAAAPDGGIDGSEPPPPPTEGSGNRFRTVHVEDRYDDGTTQRRFIAFYDRELGHRCMIQELGPGRFACLPEDLLLAYEG